MACDFSQAWFGRFSLAWEGGGTADSRLMDWLDPLGSDVMEMGGLAESQLGTVSGTIVTYFDEDPVAGVEVTLSLDGNDISVITNADGSFNFQNVGAALNYTLSFSKNTVANNGGIRFRYSRYPAAHLKHQRAFWSLSLFGRRRQ